MFEQDYLMRIIAQLMGAIRRSMERAGGDENPEGAAQLLDLAVGDATDLDGEALLSLAPESLAGILSVSGVDPILTEHIARTLMLARPATTRRRPCARPRLRPLPPLLGTMWPWRTCPIKNFLCSLRGRANNWQFSRPIPPKLAYSGEALLNGELGTLKSRVAIPSRAARGRKEESIMAEGTVKWFNPEKGYGFISQNDGEDVVVHFSEGYLSGFKTLNEGDAVYIEVTEGRDGKLQASNVERL